MWLLSTHRKTCIQKQQDRSLAISSLDASYHAALTPEDTLHLNSSLSTIIANVHRGTFTPSSILKSFSKMALRAHKETNCLTEILIPDAERWAEKCNIQGPLAGVPISLKDSVSVEGYDSTIGYSSYAYKPLEEDCGLVKLLRDAGAIPFVKTAIPITLMSFESTNDVWGRCTNPHDKNFSPGGSSGGEAALLGYGGSLVGIGTDVAGSVRVPAHFSGVYSIKSSVGRFPKAGPRTSMPGQEGVAPIVAPMARRLDDLETFWKAVVGMKPWNYDHSCLPIPWREYEIERPARWGVMKYDGVVRPSPACQRALDLVVSALRSAGHNLVEVDLPDPYEGVQIGSQLIIADGGSALSKPMGWFETNDAGVSVLFSAFRTPLWMKRIFAFFVRWLFKDNVTAGLVEGFHRKTVSEVWELNVRRESYKARWHQTWKKEGLDFLLCVPHALPAVPHGGMRRSVASCGYTFLFNVLDYTAGVMPVTMVDREKDNLPIDFIPGNAIEKAAFSLYDVDKMDGLPVGVQVVCGRLEEEKVLAGMKEVHRVLKTRGLEYMR